MARSDSGGAIAGNSAGIITTSFLFGSSSGDTALTANNAIANVQSFTTGGDFSLTDTAALTVLGAVGATGNLTLTSNGAITLYAPVSGVTVDLVSGGAISQNGVGTITATTLTGSSTGSTILPSQNAIANLGSFSTTNAPFALTDAQDLTIDGALNVGTSYAEIYVDGALSESGPGTITAQALTGSSTSATLNGANAVTYLGGFSTSSGAFQMTNAQSLATTGTLSSAGDVTLTTDAGSDLAIYAPLSGTTVDLVSGGSISQNGGGTITATTLTGSSATSTVLFAANAVQNLGSFTTSGGQFLLNEAAPLTVAGPVNAGSYNLTLETAAGDDLAIDGALTSLAVTLDSGAAITSNSAGITTTSYLFGSSSGDATLTANNNIGNVQSFATNNGNFSLTDVGALTVLGAINAGTGNLTLNSGGSITLYAPVSGAAVDLVSGGTIGQNSVGIITATTLTGSSSGQVTLTNASNVVDNLGNFSTDDANFYLTDSTSLTETGTISTGTGSAHIVSSGTITVDAAQTVSGSATLTLDASDALAINAPVTVTGAGTAVLDAGYDTTTVPGSSLLELSFGPGGNISYGSTNNGGALAINGTPYTLLYTMSDIQNIGSGTYALADSVTASGTHASAVVSSFSGTLEGLGNAITGLNINDLGTAINTADGLFGTIDAAATVRDLVLANVTVTGGNYGVEGALAGENLGTVDRVTVTGDVFGAATTEVEGGFIGNNNGIIANSSVSGTISGSGYENMGGLVGANGFSFEGSTEGAGTIVGSSVTGTVTATTASNAGIGAVGGLAGYNVGAVENSFTDTTVTELLADQSAGGLVGVNSGLIAESYSTGSTTYSVGYGRVGGLAGGNMGLIETSAAIGAVNGGDHMSVGGLVGDNNYGSVISSAASGNVTGGSYGYAGGLVGDSGSENPGSIAGSAAQGTVSGGVNSYIGGLVGYITGSLTKSYATGSVTGTTGDYIGGLAGLVEGAVSQTYATGSVTAGANAYAGGLIGEAASAFSDLVSNSYATGNVSAGSNSNAGGFLGLSGTDVSTVYSTGTVSGGSGSNVGGLIGQEDYGYSIVTDVYWNTTTSGLSNGVGLFKLANGGTDPEPVVTGLTTTQLQTALPTGFGTSVWALYGNYNDGFPYLQALASSY